MAWRINMFATEKQKLSSLWVLDIRVSLEKYEMYLSLHVKSPVFLHDFN
jgi:hypothetical protein